jgi:hypothetical protein
LNRRALLRTLVAAPGAGAVLATVSEAAEYASAGDVLAEIDRLEGEVDLRLRALAETTPGAKAFARSVIALHERERKERERLRRRLGVAPSSGVRADAAALTSLEALRTAQEALVHAHAEGMPAVQDPLVVQALARHMVEEARHLTVIDLWIESEANRG